MPSYLPDLNPGASGGASFKSNRQGDLTKPTRVTSRGATGHSVTAVGAGAFLSNVATGSIEHNLVTAHFFAFSFMLALSPICAAADSYAVFVSNERSGDVTVIDGQTDGVIATIAVGKRPRGIHYSSAAQKIFVVTSGSPRMAPGVDAERAPADKTADGLVVIDPAQRKMINRWHVGSDPEQFAISKDGRFAFIANEDEASMSIIDLNSGQERGHVKVSEEPEGVGVNPMNGDVYVTCEEKGEVFVISPNEQKIMATIAVGSRPRSVVFLPDGSRAFIPSENSSSLTVVDAKVSKVLKEISLGEAMLPMGTVMSADGRELYVTTGRGNSVIVIDTQKDSVVTSVAVGKRAWGIALSPSGEKIYTANGASDDVSVVDARTRTELKRIKVGSGPWGIAVAPNK
jgi:YVTN family beta-propeller protein